MANQCSVAIGSMPSIQDPTCATKLFAIGSDGKGYKIRIDDLWSACPPLRIKQKAWAAPNSGTLSSVPGLVQWPTDKQRVQLFYKGLLLSETTIGGSDWTAVGADEISYPAGFTGGELVIMIFKFKFDL